MAPDEKLSPSTIEAIWRAYLTTGTVPDFIREPWYRRRRLTALYHRLPANPRCRLCHIPFRGIGGALMRGAFQTAPSRLNPQICNVCEQFAQEYSGGAEVELTILFADVRGSTALAESMRPADFSRLINNFYHAATRPLFQHGAMVEKLVGDAVTAFFTPGHAGPGHASAAFQAAREILAQTGHGSPGGPWVPVGVGIHTGPAYVGSVHNDAGVADIAVLGDTPNTGARLCALAGPGEIAASRAAALAAGIDPSAAAIHSQTLKGRAEPVEVWVLRGQESA